MLINAKLLASAALYQAVNDTRLCLNGVNLAPGKDGKGVNIVATDGHVLFAGFDKGAVFNVTEKAFSVALPNDVIAKLKKHWNKFAKITHLTEQYCRVSIGDTSHKLRITYEKYPNWRYSLPPCATHPIASVETAPAYINPKYFKLIGETGLILSPEKPTITMITTGPTTAAMIRYASEFGEALSVVMPLKSDPFEELTFI